MLKTIKKLLTAFVLLSLIAGLSLPVLAAPAPTEPEMPQQEALHIGTVKEFLDFAQNCRIDSYSEKLLVCLDKDLDLSHTNFESIPIFCGTLDGQGHLISGMNLTGAGSCQGLFRYLSDTALVKNLRVRGVLSPEGSQSCIGGIAGSNAGTIQDCQFEGTLHARDSVGGIVGVNTLTGTVADCENRGTISAEHKIGGIAGENLGVIKNCRNFSQVNISSQDNTVKVTSITLDTLKGTEDPHTVTDVGGIAGTSSGVIRSCTNRGNVGYRHMGYNIGGIAGSHRGYITDCKNYGDVFGRKEAGGIVGQFLPVTRIEFAIDTLQILEKQLSGATSALNRASYNAQSNVGSIGEGIDILREDSALAQDAISQILGGLDSLDADEILAAQNALGDSLYSMHDTMGYLSETIHGTAGQLARDLKSVSSQLSSIGQTLRDAKNTTGATLTDVSDQDTPENKTGKVDTSRNYGTISGDINAGGIAGSISFEASTDPEEDVEILGKESLNAEGELRAVIVQCENRGTVTGSKIHTGGIVGCTDLGLVRDCVNTGILDGEKAQYVGGIAGSSQGYIRNCHVKCQLIGSSYVGGIAGSGTIVTDCLSMVQLENVTERQGAILGIAEEALLQQEEDPVRNNFYMSLSQDPGAIDGISYRGLAEPMSPSAFISQENLPQAFQETKLVFRYEDGTEKELVLPVGSSLKHIPIPLLPDKDGFPGEWEGLDEYSKSRIYFDRVFIPVYEPERITIRSAESRENGRPILLAEGMFPDRNRIDLGTMEMPQIPDKRPVEAWKLPAFSDTEETVLHFSYPAELDPEYLEILLRDRDGSWRQVPCTVNASCLVFSVRPGEDAFAVSLLPDYRPWIYLAGGIAAVGALLLILKLKQRKKKVKKA